MNIWWLIIGIIYIALAIPYFHLARKARQKIDIKNFQINKMSGERFMPTGNAALEVNMTLDQHGISSEIRSASLKIIVDYANQLIDNVQHHLNHVILPSIKKYLDETSQTNTNGFIVAGLLSIAAAVVAFCSAFSIF